MPRISNLALLLCLALSLPYAAQAGTLRDDGISAYSAGNVSLAQKSLEGWLTQNPTDRLARFYLAHCYLSAGRTREAYLNYTKCCAASKSDQITVAANQALDLIAKSQVNGAGAIPSNVAALSPEERDAITKRQSLLVAKITDDAQRRIADKRELLESQLERVDARLRESIASLTKWCNFGGGKVEDPDYAPSVAALRERAALDRIRMTDSFAFAEAKIRKDADKKIHDLGLTASGMKEQMKSSRGAIGLIPDGTCLHVRNYMNFPDASESDHYKRPTVPLRAGPALLLKPSSPARAPASKSGK